MKIVVRGISDAMLKEEVKVIIREFCECDSVYTKGDFSNKGNLKGVEAYPVGSKSLIGYIQYDVASRNPKSYGVIKRRQLVKVYSLKAWGEHNEV